MVNWKARIRERLLEAGHTLDEDVVEELATHAAAAYETQRADNAAPDEAEQHVICLIDSWLTEAAHLRRRTSIRIEATSKFTSVPFAGFPNDVRHAFRAVTRRPGFAALTVATMALGIGVTTVLFSVAYSVLLKPLPWPEPDRLIQVTETHRGATRNVSGLMTNTAYLPWKEQPSTVEGLGAWSKQQMNLTGRGESERITVAAATASLFSVLRANPLVGQVFTEADERPSQGGSVVLSYGIWQARFAGTPRAIGEILVLDGRPYTIRGVMPRDFAFPDRETQAWIPLSIPPVVAPDGQTRRAVMFNAIARLRSGSTPRQAAAEATARARSAPDPGLAALAVFGSNGPAEVSAVPVLDALTRNVRPALIALAVAVVLLLATGVANTLNLQIANATARLREVAIRSALGAKMRRSRCSFGSKV